MVLIFILNFFRPWRQGGDLAQQLYRPKKGGDNDIYGEDLDNAIKTNRFVPDKEFSGTSRTAGSSRSGPVQFEQNAAAEEEDPFGLDQFLQQAKRSGKRGTEEKSGSGKASSSSSSDKRRRRD